MEYLTFGKITGTVGLKGEVKAYVTSTFTDLRLQKGYTLFIKINNEYKPFKVKSSRFKGGNFFIIQFEDLESIEEAEKYKNCEIFSIKDQEDLYDNEYFYSDLVGLKVINEENEDRGIVVSVEEFPAQITLKVKFNDKFYFVPFNDFFVPNVDLKNKILTLHEIGGLIE